MANELGAIAEPATCLDDAVETRLRPYVPNSLITFGVRVPEELCGGQPTALPRLRGGLGNDAVHSALLFRGHRFPPEIISRAVWPYHRFTLNFRDVEDLVAEPGVTMSYEAIGLQCRKFGPTIARNLCRR